MCYFTRRSWGRLPACRTARVDISLPKAHYLSQRTMEIFRQHGLGDEVLAMGCQRTRPQFVRSPGWAVRARWTHAKFPVRRVRGPLRERYAEASSVTRSCLSCGSNG
ncbi:FAD-dependent monooxygenase [Amycolatopsis sp. NPDC005232]|uniref:FAD-dependent monooxygenase n=1 Tax=Amycolatopsis sp. NPDC005232 TaxID=3157027 RepID=UPI0033B3FC42